MSSNWHCVGCGTALSQVGYSYCNVCNQTNILLSLHKNNNTPNTPPNPIVDGIGNFVGGFISTIFYIFIFLCVLSIVFKLLDI